MHSRIPKPFIAPAISLVACLLLLTLSLAAEARKPGGDWFDEQAAKGPGSPSIRVDLGEQRAYFYKGKKLVGTSKVSSGRAGFRTPKGNFRVLAKKSTHRSSQFGSYVSNSSHKVVRSDIERRKSKQPAGTHYRGAKMDYYIRFHRGVGFHASGNVPRHPASHGCIRMPKKMARLFYRHAPVGTRVKVTG